MSSHINPDVSKRKANNDSPSEEDFDTFVQNIDEDGVDSSVASKTDLESESGSFSDQNSLALTIIPHTTKRRKFDCKMITSGNPMDISSTAANTISSTILPISFENSCFMPPSMLILNHQLLQNLNSTTGAMIDEPFLYSSKLLGYFNEGDMAAIIRFIEKYCDSSCKLTVTKITSDKVVDIKRHKERVGVAEIIEFWKVLADSAPDAVYLLKNTEKLRQKFVDPVNQAQYTTYVSQTRFFATLLSSIEKHREPMNIVVTSNGTITFQIDDEGFIHRMDFIYRYTKTRSMAN